MCKEGICVLRCRDSGTAVAAAPGAAGAADEEVLTVPSAVPSSQGAAAAQGALQCRAAPAGTVSHGSSGDSAWQGSLLSGGGAVLLQPEPLAESSLASGTAALHGCWLPPALALRPQGRAGVAFGRVALYQQ